MPVFLQMLEALPGWAAVGLVVYHHTAGYRREEHPIPISEFMDLTGLSHPGAHAAIKSAEARGVINVKRADPPDGLHWSRKTPIYSMGEWPPRDDEVVNTDLTSEVVNTWLTTEDAKLVNTGATTLVNTGLTTCQNPEVVNTGLTSLVNTDLTRSSKVPTSERTSPYRYIDKSIDSGYIFKGVTTGEEVRGSPPRPMPSKKKETPDLADIGMHPVVPRVATMLKLNQAQTEKVYNALLDGGTVKGIAARSGEAVETVTACVRAFEDRGLVVKDGDRYQWRCDHETGELA